MADARLTILVSIDDPDRADELLIELEEQGFAAVAEREAGRPLDIDVVVADRAPLDRTTPHVLVGFASQAANVRGCLPAAAPAATVAAAARLAAAGFGFQPFATMEPDDQEPADAPASVHLTARERQVLALLTDGAPNKVIARALDISVHTAKFHVAALLQKLGARNRTDAIVIAIRDGHVLY